jgi:peptidoglycan/LPS O-acetylase OafA/YrhL
MAHHGYRPDIDGLRAVAILAVIIVHAFPAALPGGFCGVDVFFVISGYLITSILHTDLEAGRCDLCGFYARRVRRLFPALLAMLFLCMAAGYVYLLPTEYESLGAQVAAGTIFAQNVLLWRQSGYFDSDAFRVPLQHLWSLAVEEQFYLVFPPLLVWAWRQRWPVARVITAMLVASFVANLFASRHAPAADFFLTPFRAWEFLAGALIACREHRGDVAAPQSRRDLASLLGGMLVAVSLIVMKPASYPGWQAALPVLGTSLLIAAGPGGWINRIVLAHPLAVWIGLVSYPLYLFHWPLLCLVRICRNDHPSPVLVAAAVVAAFVLAAMTYVAIERPLRSHRSRWTVPGLVVGFLLAGLAGLAIATRWIPPKHASPELDGVIAATRDHLGRFMYSHRKDLRVRKNVYETGGAGPQTLFFGDSFAGQYVPRAVTLVADNRADERGAVVLSAGAIPPIPGVTSGLKPECPVVMQKFRDLLAEDPRIDRVVIAACWHYYFETDRDYTIDGIPLDSDAGAGRAAEAFEELLEELTASGKSVTLVLSSPSGRELEPAGMLVRSLRGRITKRLQPLTVDQLLARVGPRARAFLESIEAAAHRHGVRIVDPLQHLAVDGVCIAEVEGVPIRYDMSHLRPEYVADRVTYLDDTLAP